jgi:hypothetical protein
MLAFVSDEGRTSMSAVIASLAVKTAVNAKRIVQRLVRALMDAKIRGILHEIEFQRRLNDHRRAIGLAPLSQHDFRGR